MKNSHWFWFSVCSLVLIHATASAELRLRPTCVDEPQLATQLEWQISSNGLLEIRYDLNGDGIADFSTMRVVAFHYQSENSAARVHRENPERLVFFVNYGADSHYYLAVGMPMFYLFDVNQDGVSDLIYKDALEDGVNGNEVYYDSPSGMF